jgi:hypothetical protein
VRRRSVDKLSNKLFIVALMIYFIGILVKQRSAGFPGRRDVSCYTSYAVPHTNAFSPAAAWYVPFDLCFVFALASAKTKHKRKVQYRCERSHLGYRVTRVMLLIRVFVAFANRRQF